MNNDEKMAHYDQENMKIVKKSGTLGYDVKR